MARSDSDQLFESEAHFAIALPCSFKATDAFNGSRFDRLSRIHKHLLNGIVSRSLSAPDSVFALVQLSTSSPNNLPIFR